jgi:hypothetical protein
MTWATLDDLELNAPSSFVETEEVIGGYNVTMTGAKRRYIKGLKKTWQFSYDAMTANDFSLLLSKYESLMEVDLQTEQPYAVFTILADGFSVSGEQVHIDLGGRTILPGTDLLSNIEITLTQL